VYRDVTEVQDPAESARSEAYRVLEESETAVRDNKSAGKEDLPVWAKEIPVLDDYYIGVEHSPDTGVLDEDRWCARLDALNELAQGITVHILSEIRDIRREEYGEFALSQYESQRALWVDAKVDLQASSEGEEVWG
jgi:hypothetical protein